MDNNDKYNPLDDMSSLFVNQGDDQIPEVDPSELGDIIDAKPKSTKTVGKVKDNVEDDDLPDVIKNALKDEPKSKKKISEPVKNFDDEIVVNEEDDVVDDDVIDKNISDLGEYESDVAAFFTDEFSKELGWEINDDERPTDVKGVVELIKKVVEENSVPNYSDNRVGKLDEFVRNGGKFEDFYSSVYQNKISLDDIDIENEFHQKAVLKEHLSNTGLKETAIEKKIKRWEDAGVLQDEAEEALESVKEFREENEQRLLQSQRKQADDNKKAQQSFLGNVDKTIKELNDVRGIELNDKKKRELLDYIFKPDSDGLTKFYKETGMIVTYNTNPKRLLESAYFAKEGDTLVKAIERKVESKAAKTLKEKLATSKGARGIDQGQTERNGRFNIFSEIGRELLPKG